jgi:hypothetical protein
MYVLEHVVDTASERLNRAVGIVCALLGSLHSQFGGSGWVFDFVALNYYARAEMPPVLGLTIGVVLVDEVGAAVQQSSSRSAVGWCKVPPEPSQLGPEDVLFLRALHGPMEQSHR